MKRATRAAVIGLSALAAYGAATAVPNGQPDVPRPLAVTNYSTVDIAVAIPDNAPTGVDIPISVSTVTALSDVNVSFRLNHTFDGDLVISLVHPDSTAVLLVNNRGGSGQNFGTGANGSAGTPTVLDDAAATAISSITAPFAGTFRPESPLSVLNGKPANGTWILRIADTASLDVGTVGLFSLRLTSPCKCVAIAAAPPPVIAAESISPPNNAADPNETLTVNLSLANMGDVNTSNLVAILQATGGVVSPSGPQNYGAVVAGGSSVARLYTFTASGNCGNTITLTLALQNGATSLGTIAYTMLLGTCGPATVPGPPTSATAAARSAKAIVGFTAPASNGGSPITGYTVVSAPDGGVDTNAGMTSLSHVVSGLTNGIAYTFRVSATNLVGSSVLSTSSNSVTPPGFMDFPLQAGVTRIKAVHLTELRKRIDLQRVRFGLLDFPWTNLTLTPGVTVIRAVHITELRTALEQTYVAAGITPLPSYSDPSLGSSTTVRMAHFSQLQFYVMAIE